MLLGLNSSNIILNVGSLMASTNKKTELGIEHAESVICHHLKPLLVSFSAIPELKFLSGEFSIEVIDASYMNHVYRIREITDKSNSSNNDVATSVIVKQAPSSNKMSKIFRNQQYDILRGKHEYLVLSRFYQILPESVPKPYLYDEPSKTLVIEDLRHHVPLRRALPSGDISVPSILCKIARYLANLHRKTSQSYLGEDDFKQLRKTFANPTQVELMRQFTIVKPFCSTDPSNKTIPEIQPYLPMIYKDNDIIKAVKKLEIILLEKQDCLIHGDLYTGHVMVHEEDVKIIDAEFAHVGASAVDMGTYLAHLLFSYHGHRLYPKDDRQHYHTIIYQAIQESLNVYLKEFRLDENQVSEIAGFTGLQLIRRIIGFGYVGDIAGKPNAELASYFTGVSLLKSYQTLTTEDEFITYLLGRNYDHGLPTE
ncbi:5-deoxyribose kinase-like [Amphiura filiformis]|uniref:5-deoxyribose kinase-like n=1 Tax=Amphiura filiformis TaxID=82378 RepID=UPI003B226110